MEINEKEAYCPYCGENISLLIDDTLQSQEYIEDCEVCCSPMIVNVEINSDEEILINTKRENE